MSRSERLLALLQLLRGHRYAITGSELASQLGISLRTLYRDLKEESSERTVWPCALGYFDQVRVLVAWCELRQDFRHFRVDRISAMRLEAEPYPGNRERLLKEWRASQQIPQPRFIADRN